MMETPLHQPQDTMADRDSVDLAALLAALRRGWKTILVCAVAASVFEAIALRDAPPLYRVEMEVAAVTGAERDSAPGTQAPGAQPGRQQSGDRTQFNAYLESLGSRGMADELAENPAVLKAIFPEKWDAEKNSWRPERSKAQRLETGLRSLLGWRIAAWQPPGGIEVRQFLATIIVDKDLKNHNLATIHMRSTRPGFAVGFMTLLNRVAEDRLRARALSQSRQTIADLEAMPNAQSDRAILRALDAQRDIEVAALSKAPFAAQILDNPSAQRDPSDRPFKSLLAALFLGIAAGLALDWSFRRLSGRRKA
jgi:uncharacterized protein involved in exopolysaccharide biosynthesis